MGVREEIALGCRTAATSADLKRVVQAFEADLTNLDYSIAICKKQWPQLNRALDGVSNAIEEMLELLLKTYPQYRDTNERVPLYQLAKALASLRSRWHRLRLKLPLHTGNGELAAIALEPILRLLKGGNGPVTVALLLYVQSLAGRYEKLVEEKSVELKEPQLIELLLGINFNAPVFIDYYTDLVKQRLQAAPENAAKLDLLQHELKCMEQWHFLPGMALYPGQRSITTALKDWLIPECRYWENKPEAVWGLVDPGKIKEWINCSKSVPVLAAINRAAYAKKFYTSPPIVIRRITLDNVKCAYSPTISDEQFRKKFNKIEPPARKAAIKELRGWIKWLEGGDKDKGTDGGDDVGNDDELEDQ
jgi:hypothetical protein